MNGWRFQIFRISGTNFLPSRRPEKTLSANNIFVKRKAKNQRGIPFGYFDEKDKG